MWRHLTPAIAFALLGISLTWVLLRIGSHDLDVREIQSPLLGKPAPIFSLPSVLDAAPRVESGHFLGAPYLVNVWGSWCAACREEHDTLLKIASQHQVTLVGLDWKDDPNAALAYLSELGNPYTEVASDQEGRVAIDWGVYGAPESFLVSAQGIVLFKFVGPLTEAVWNDQFLPRLQKGAP